MQTVTGDIFTQFCEPPQNRFNMRIAQMGQCAIRALFLAALMFFAPLHFWAQSPVEGARKVLSKTPVPYPSIARSMMLRGSVRVDAQVAANGTVTAVEVRGGHPILA